nr:MAG TPA: Integrase [Caudoviricetes sp.]
MPSVYKRGKKWRGQETIGGKRFSFTGNTKKDVQILIAEAIANYEKTNLIADKNIKVSDWVEMWLDKRSDKVSRQTYEALRSNFKNHLLPYLGNMKLCDLNKNIIEEAYAKSFFRKDCKDYAIKEYSHSTVNALSVQFKKCLQYAVDSDILAKNPHNGVELHKLRPPKKVISYSREDQIKIIKYLSDCTRKKQVFYLLISTGMRVGEVCALKWDDIDFEQKKISISKTAISYHGSMIIQNHPKTDNSVRTIYMVNPLYDYLKKIHSSQNPETNIFNLVVPTSRYTIQNPSNLRKYWKRMCAEIGIRYDGLHVLRHTWATRALEEGMDVKTVSDLLGHKNVITTMNIYQDSLDEHKRKEVKKINQLY